MLEVILLLLSAMIFIAVVVLDWFIGDGWWFDE